MESLDHLEEGACLVLMVHLVLKVKMVTEVKWDLLDLKVNLEILVDLEHLDCKA